MAKAIGERGSWFAKVDGKRLPCIHKKRLKVMTYIDPFDRHEGTSKVKEFIDALTNEKQAILTDGTPIMDDAGKIIGWDRGKYIAIYRLDDIHFDDTSGLKMRLVERLAELD